MNNSNDVFLKQMEGVSPIKKSNRVEKRKPELKKNTIQKKINIKNTKVEKTKIKIKKSEFNLEKISIKKNIKRGSFKIDKKIDFHGQTLLESEAGFSNTILDCYNKGLRCLLFVTGKGAFKSKNNDYNEAPKLYHGVIRSAFNGWVKSERFSKQILSFEPASIEHGGDGAFYVYLRKKKN